MSDTIANIVVVQDANGESTPVRLAYTAGGAAIGLLQSSGAYWDPDKLPQSAWCDVVCISDWSATPKVAWLSCLRLEKGIVIRVQENTSGVSRTGTIELTVEGYSDPHVILTVRQAGTVAPKVFQVDPPVIDATSSKGSYDIALRCPGTWSLRGNRDWARGHTKVGNRTTGTYDAELVVDVEPNPYQVERTAQLFITDYMETRVVEIRQAAKVAEDSIAVSNDHPAFTAGNPATIAVTVTASSTWEAEPAPSWLTVTKEGDTLTLKPSVNTGAARTADIALTCRTATVTVRASQQAGSSITVTPPTLPEIAATSTTPATFTVKSARPVIVTASNGWLTVTITGVTTDENGFYIYTVQYTPTVNEFEARTSNIAIYDGEQTKTLTATQAAGQAYAVQITPSVLVLGAGATSAVTAVVSAPEGWTPSTTSSWISVEKSGPNALTVTPTDSSNKARSAEISVTAGPATSVLAVSQNAASVIEVPASLPELGFATPPVQFFHVRSALPIVISAADSWVWVYVDSFTTEPDGMLNYTCRVSAPTNTVASPRTSTISVTDGMQTKTIPITQKAADIPEITFDPASLSIPGNSTAYVSVSVEATRAWDIKSFPDWLTVDRERNSLGITPQVNSTGAIRTGNIVLLSVGVEFSLPVTQQA